MGSALVSNLTVIIAAVGIPFALMALFAVIRRQTGNSMTAMPDVFVFLSSINLYFAVWPEPWKGMIYPLVKDAFPALSLFLGISAMALFAGVLSVEKRIWMVPDKEPVASTKS